MARPSSRCGCEPTQGVPIFKNSLLSQTKAFPSALPQTHRPQSHANHPTNQQKQDVYGQSVLITRTSASAFAAHLLPAAAAAAVASAAATANAGASPAAAAIAAGARPLTIHRDVDGALWVTVPVPSQLPASQPEPASKLDGAAAAADPAGAAARALAQAGPMPTPLAPLGGCDRKFVPPSPQKQPDFGGVGLAHDADARRALLGVPGGGGGGGGGSQSQPGSQPLSPGHAASLHRLPPSARASPVAMRASPFKDRVDAATAAVVRKQRSLFPAAAAATGEAAAAVKAAPPPQAPWRDRGIGGIPGSQEVPDV